MIPTFNLKNNTEQEIEGLKNSINLTIEKNTLIRINNGFKYLTLNNWNNLLEEKLSLDKRHYSSESAYIEKKWFTISYNPEKEFTYMHSKTKQPLHVDNTWFKDPAEIVLMCYAKQVEKGGENTFYPLDRLKEDLANEEPGLFNDLQTKIVKIQKGDGKYFNLTTILSDDKIFWNYYRTEKTKKDIKTMCVAFFNFLEKKEKTNRVDKVKINTNDALLWCDHYMLHGRLAFEAKTKNDRVLYQSQWKKK